MCWAGLLTIASAAWLVVLSEATAEPQRDPALSFATLVKQAPPRSTDTTIGMMTGDADETEHRFAADLASTLSSNQETGPHGEVPFRVRPEAGGGELGEEAQVDRLGSSDPGGVRGVSEEHRGCGLKRRR